MSLNRSLDKIVVILPPSNWKSQLRSEYMVFNDLDLMRDQIRMDQVTDRLVIVMQPMYHKGYKLPEGVETMPWLVKDILSGKILAREEMHLWGRIYTELEALAWAAQDHPEVELPGE